MVVKCRPFNLPQEFTSIVIVAVYIPSRHMSSFYIFIMKPSGINIINNKTKHIALLTTLKQFLLVI